MSIILTTRLERNTLTKRDGIWLNVKLVSIDRVYPFSDYGTSR
jgi:hypothetical protein